MKARGIIVVAVGVFAGLIALLTVAGAFYRVDQGERGVLLRNGAITGTAEPGLGFMAPWIDDVRYFSIQSRFKLYSDMETYSRDQQPATLRLSVNYRMPADRVTEIYTNYGSESALVERLVDRQVFEKSKTVFGMFNAVTAIQERARLNIEVSEAIRAGIDGPIIIESVQIEDITFSDAYENSIEQRMLAEVEVQRLRQNAEREKVQAEITVTQAKARADAVRAEAEAQAEAIKLRGEAEAEAIHARGRALRDNPSLIELVQAEKWNGTLPTTMVPGGAVPFLSVTPRPAAQ